MCFLTPLNLTKELVPSLLATSTAMDQNQASLTALTFNTATLVALTTMMLVFAVNQVNIDSLYLHIGVHIIHMHYSVLHVYLDLRTCIIHEHKLCTVLVIFVHVYKCKNE